MQDLLGERILPWFGAAALGVTCAGIEWWRSWVPSPPAPVPVTVLALAFAVYAGVRIRGSVRELKNLKQGRDGERAVAELLEELRTKGCKVFHDIPGDGFNLDHVLISPRGVYVIETKTLSKPMDRNARIVFDGSEIRIDGVALHSDYLAQARAERDWLRNLLKEQTGKTFPVRGILVFPGWYVKPAGNWRRSDVWVLNPKNVGGFLAREPVCIKPEDVALASSRVADHVRRS